MPNGKSSAIYIAFQNTRTKFRGIVLGAVYLL
ncbi:unknown [[Mannheimia] succiniciproducens MBEL55E]|uniref:Uncharacterized protein n=1 Tax=Mannheimia succiniciproducens (strain KCTC 0769BP / MBEL55E) TaxID=221988 RepID=Q65U24_MANSM|nr:unknown [[Mannheimia] succiniciproducens MBEL55E]